MAKKNWVDWLNWRRAFVLWIVLSVVGCAVSIIFSIVYSKMLGPVSNDSLLQSLTETINPYQIPTRLPGTPIVSPTPEPPKVFPTQRTDVEEYIVQSADTLETIAQRFSVDVNALIQENQLKDPNQLSAGQVLVIPLIPSMPSGPDFKIIPDSELVYAPLSIGFNVGEFISEKGGYLNSYTEEIDHQLYSGSEIVMRVASEYSVNPRILLVILDQQSGWVTQSQISTETLEFPIRKFDVWRKGLYLQLSWAADRLNYGYYVWKANGIYRWIFPDGSSVPISPTINAGTAAVQYLMSKLYKKQEWERTVSSEGVFNIYQNFFGYPFDYAFEPVIPVDLSQPQFQLPFETGSVWSFTSGPHGGWGEGSGWDALDFAPPGVPVGCIVSPVWAVAISDGLVIRSGNGVVVLDLDGDGKEQTGWTILYLHVDSQDRVLVGTMLKAGDRIGHPSCEGGISYGTHLHIARRYNGEWIPADGSLPFILDGWISEGTGVEYDGFLRRNDQVVEAWDAYRPENQIQR